MSCLFWIVSSKCWVNVPCNLSTVLGAFEGLLLCGQLLDYRYMKSLNQKQADGGCTAGRLWASTCGMHSLQQLLDNQDSVLGPAVPGRDPLLDALNSFVGTPGSPALRPWEQGLPNQTDPAGQLAGLFTCFRIADT